jgi:O-antigen ligase
MRLERPPRHSWLKRIHSGHVLGTAALLTPALGVFGPKLIATLAILTVAALLGLSVHDRNQWTLDKSLLAILGSLGAWITVTFWWSIDSGETFAKWGLTAIAGLTVVYLLSDSATLRGPFHQSLQNLVLAGIAIGFASILFEVATENALSRNLLSKDEANIELINRSTSVLLVFIWLAVTILWQRAPSVALGIVALGFAIGYILPSASALLGYVAGSFAFLCAIWTPRVTSAVVAAIFSLGILTAPILPTIVPPPPLKPDYWLQSPEQANPSLIHRLDIWQFTIKRIAERPLQGWGFKASGAIPGGGEHYFLRDSQQRVIGQGNRLPLHPHNGALQVWLELGLPGAIGFAALFALAAYRTGRGSCRVHSAMALAVIATIGTSWLLSYGIWQGWWMGVIVIAAFLVTTTRDLCRTAYRTSPKAA